MFSLNIKKPSPKPVSMTPLVEYKLSERETIPVRKKDKTTVNVPVSDLSQFFNISMTQGIVYQSQHAAVVEKLKVALHPSPQSEALKVKAFLQNPQNYFTIAHINDVCGYGLIANRDIPKGTVVGIYSGEMLVRTAEEKDGASLDERAYDMGLADNITIDNKVYSFSMRAHKHGDLTRFAPHAPSRGTVLPLGNIDGSQVLTANMEYPLAIIDGKPVRYYVTTEDIKKGQPMLINYGEGYWKRRGNPALFVRKNNQIYTAYYNNQTMQYALSNEVVFAEPLEQKAEMMRVVKGSATRNVQVTQVVVKPKPEVKPEINTLGQVSQQRSTSSVAQALASPSSPSRQALQPPPPSQQSPRYTSNVAQVLADARRAIGASPLAQPKRVRFQSPKRPAVSSVHPRASTLQCSWVNSLRSSDFFVPSLDLPSSSFRLK